MGDMISRTAAIDAIVSGTIFQDAEDIKRLCENPIKNQGWLGGVCDAINAVEEVNAVPAAPVVRCRECRYWRQEVSPTEHWVCAHHSFNERKMYTTPDFYCADGERKEGE